MGALGYLSYAGFSTYASINFNYYVSEKRSFIPILSDAMTLINKAIYHYALSYIGNIL